MSRVVVLAGGSPHAHDFESIGTALTTIVGDAGHDARFVADPDVAAALLHDSVDALVVDGLWWRMHGETYDAWRDDHGYSPTEPTREALMGFVRGGGGLVAMHTTTISFDDWAEWGDVLGGAWQWGTSSHPPYGPVVADIVADHPVVAGLPPTIELHDEVYGDLDLRDGIEVLATARRSDDDDEQPVVWAHAFGLGRVVVDGFGHDVASICEPAHTQLILQAVDWVDRSSRPTLTEES